MACGDGWEPIIRHLSQRITKIVETVVGPHPNSEDTECMGGNKRSKRRWRTEQGTSSPKAISDSSTSSKRTEYYTCV
jgi:hypothetical protein